MPPFDTDVVADVKAAASLSGNIRRCVSAVTAPDSLVRVRRVFTERNSVGIWYSRRYHEGFVRAHVYGRK